jgi:hypothetical protein
MFMRAVRVLCALAIPIAIFTHGDVYGQRERQIQPPSEQQAQYGRRFFTQLRAVFGKFRDADLQRVFASAQPIECSEFVNGDGQWRTVAFFNEKRELGDWYRSNFEEVKSDLSVFLFKGVCRGERGPVQLTTKFPVTESVDAYNHGAIPADNIEVNVNAPVSVFFNSQTQAYSFDLPYLFLISRQNDESIYSLEPPRLTERESYASDVLDHWDCKSVGGESVTYHFLICRTTTLPRDPRIRSQVRSPAFGASAYFILSDGREASSSVTLSFNDAGDAKHSVEDLTAPATPEVNDEPPLRWQLADSDDRLVDLGRDPFRIRFTPDTWRGRIANAQVLSQGRLFSLESSKATPGVDYCVWFPGDSTAIRYLLASDPQELLNYTVTGHDQDSQAPTSLTFEMKTPTGLPAGNLKCTFPKTASIRGITVSQWISIVGDNLILEEKSQ